MMVDYISRKTLGPATGPLVFTFHGTGGDENQFHGFTEQVLPQATIVSPRGDVSENGAARYFRRTGEGVYDMADLGMRTEQMATFLADTKARYARPRTIGLGYSNGANILASVMTRYPDIFDAVVLLHPLIPWEPDPHPVLAGKRVLITAGRKDPICPAPMTDRLHRYFERQDARTQLHWHPGGHEIDNSELIALRHFLTE
ncbi:esterase [Actibacterium mucosum KCTC 23349]|uniref:Esterase n=1 Tax=Actibacterium mucosum KCTC 23349 TaxID=1454373 RepID=A0A037ZNT3_9RHOB|nr:alpha/beta hydrolase [Actibacterium mucosum]KAJ57320.1 esterase [Actibacterium mucosum KCTC 23349]